MKKNKLSILTNGIIKENPVLVLVLGTCPTLATTTSAINGLGMGVAATAVLVFSNLIISLLKSVIPDKVRIPSYIVVIAYSVQRDPGKQLSAVQVPGYLPLPGRIQEAGFCGGHERCGYLCNADGHSCYLADL